MFFRASPAADHRAIARDGNVAIGKVIGRSTDLKKYRASAAVFNSVLVHDRSPLGCSGSAQARGRCERVCLRCADLFYFWIFHGVDFLCLINCLSFVRRNLARGSADSGVLFFQTAPWGFISYSFLALSSTMSLSQSSGSTSLSNSAIDSNSSPVIPTRDFTKRTRNS